MINTRVVIAIILLLLVGYIYNKWEQKNKNKNFSSDYELVERFFLGNRSLANIKKPIIWIHINYDINARKWDSFYSRNNNNLNQDYLYLTLRSIIEKYGNKFHICLINDNSFFRLLSKWPQDLVSYPDPLRKRLRSLGLAKVLHSYGGIIIPVSFIANRCFGEIYDNLNEEQILIGELPNNSVRNEKYCLNPRIMGCKMGSKKMLQYINYLEDLYLNNFTNSIEFEDSEDLWFIKNKDNLLIISSIELGGEDNCGRIVNIDRLLNSTFIDFSKNRYGIYIPDEELIRRIAYNWFVYLTVEEVLNSNTQIGKNILISQAN